MRPADCLTSGSDCCRRAVAFVTICRLASQEWRRSALISSILPLLLACSVLDILIRCRNLTSWI